MIQNRYRWDPQVHEVREIETATLIMRKILSSEVVGSRLSMKHDYEEPTQVKQET